MHSFSEQQRFEAVKRQLSNLMMHSKTLKLTSGKLEIPGNYFRFARGILFHRVMFDLDYLFHIHKS